MLVKSALTLRNVVSALGTAIQSIEIVVGKTSTLKYFRLRTAQRLTGLLSKSIATTGKSRSVWKNVSIVSHRGPVTIKSQRRNERLLLIRTQQRGSPSKPPGVPHHIPLSYHARSFGISSIQNLLNTLTFSLTLEKSVLIISLIRSNSSLLSFGKFPVSRTN